ncbi:IstB domain-containing protein ATP-binding protein [Calderihabitans maritimus]|uniref:IstB domain-containing protein ATP-binding protein n=1 Tax=Calderihabitans maritimus TaxID=1246530 RepID=A0A1Z5HS88_9FIRM|nr:IstB domain-containing protein ATP-binding protein [Calderihabitans maritimus]
MPQIYLDIPYSDREQYLADLFEAKDARRANRVKRLKKAGFPVHKTLEDFDWKAVTLPETTKYN